MRVNDALSGLAILGLAGYILVEARGYPALAGQAYGPGLLPTAIAIGLGATGLLLIARGMMTARAEPWVQRPAWMHDPRATARAAAIPILVVAYILLAGPIGFVPVTGAILTLLLAWLWRPSWWAPVIGFGAAIAIFVFFARLMLVPLPNGLVPIGWL